MGSQASEWGSDAHHEGDGLGESARELWSATRDTVTSVKQALDIEGRVKQHPYGMIFAALGVGYVLGGGLFSGLTARVLGTGLRVALRLGAIPYLRDELLRKGEQS